MSRATTAEILAGAIARAGGVAPAEPDLKAAGSDFEVAGPNFEAAGAMAALGPGPMPGPGQTFPFSILGVFLY